MPKKDEQTGSFDQSALSATADRAVAAVDAAGAKGEGLVNAWVAAGNAAAVLEVSERGSGAARKAARRGLNVLRARKVPIPELRRVAALTAKEPAEVLEAWMMAPDSSGMQLFTITSRGAGGRLRTVFVFLHGAQGIARVENSSLSASGLREYFDKVLPGAGYGATKIPLEWARFRIADARRVHRERGLPEPLGFTTAAPLLEPVPAEAPSHPFDDEGFELADDDAADLAKTSGQLHNIPEFRSWLPTNEAMQEVLIAVGQKLVPGETPEPGVVTEHLQAEAAAATDRFFTPELRAELLRRMKDSALSALARDGEQRALEVAAVMKRIEQCGLVTNPPRDVPFLRAFFDKAVAMMLAQGGGRLRIPMPMQSLADAAPAPAAEAAP
ncbi:MAG TPA: hypothetical protein VHE30_23525 [Polyangiaceae bacterium]|nr:hypothetical protein [Polyangiaceae bacterium]